MTPSVPSLCDPGGEATRTTSGGGRGRRLKTHLHPHLFRHTYATRLHEIGVDLLVIQGLLGHESVAKTEIYTRVSVARQRQAIQALGTGICT